ncbi:protein WALLS ARE THIN 1-like [Prosopis cineraria]|uniref:protein WALLS ARE THIN 1-like n=1 Tax=Prosopis cineraria TaxID=364024 RepID=UPI00240FE31F|nr:protein WALLS ARE THIN 1-like [Prosopis cineraria]
MVLERAKLHIILTFLQFCHAGNHFFLRLALNMGVSKLVLPVYRNIIALILLGPLAYFSEKNQRPLITISCVIRFSLLGLVGITMKEGFYLVGLENTSPTFASAMQNSVPALTFLMAVILRFESVRLNRVSGVAKVLGVIASVAGASVITLFKGPIIYNPRSALHQKYLLPLLVGGHGKSWTLGCIGLIGHCLSWSGWIVMQASVLKKFPAPLSVSASTCFFGIMQFLMLAASFEHDSESWHLNSSDELYSLLYAGVVVSALAAALQIWAIGKGGPVFTSVYQPVQTIIVGLITSFALGEEFFLGGILGASLIIFGLYLVVWGKSEEAKPGKEVTVPLASEKHVEENFENSSLVQPLIPPQIPQRATSSIDLF